MSPFPGAPRRIRIRRGDLQLLVPCKIHIHIVPSQQDSHHGLWFRGEDRALQLVEGQGMPRFIIELTVLWDRYS
jgi:hypothetical protein